MDCRGKERRQWIVDNYNVQPVAHIQLLKGQTKHSDAGAVIENDYYIFEAVNKRTDEKDIIQCGMGASRDFLAMLNHKGLPLFNPLHRDARNVVSGGREAQPKNTERQNKDTWNPIAEQLYNAIMWTIIIINAKPNSPIFDIREKVYQYKYKRPFDSQIRGVNTIIQKNLQGKTLTEAINKLRENNNVRNNMCQFDLLIEAIGKTTDKSGKILDIESYF